MTSVALSGPGVIDQFLDVFSRYIDSGFGLVRGDVGSLASILVALDVTLAALFWLWGPGEELLVRFVRKILYVGTFAFILSNFQGLAQVVYASFASLGLEAGGSSMAASDLLHPGHIAAAGIAAVRPLLAALGELAGFPAIFENFVQAAIILAAVLVVLAAFFVLAVQLFVVVIEFKLTTLAGFVLVPFGLFGRTAFLAERVLGNVMASGVKVLVLAVIVGIGSTLFQGFVPDLPSSQPTLDQALAIALAALSLLGLGLFAPAIASGLVSGAPHLGAGAAVGTTLGAAGAAVAGAAVVRSAAGAAGAAVRGGARALSAAQAARGAGPGGGPGPDWPSGPDGRPSGGSSGGSSAGPNGGSGGGPNPAGSPVGGPRLGEASRGASFGADGRAAAPISDAPAQDEARAERAAVDPRAPAWARALRRRQALAAGVSAAANAIRSGDHAAAAAVPLDQEKP